MPLPAHVQERLTQSQRQALAKPMSAPALSGLRGLSLGPLKPVLPEPVVKELVQLGYARETFGGTVLTDEGTIRAMQES